jgi:hypothetical protein
MDGHELLRISYSFPFPLTSCYSLLMKLFMVARDPDVIVTSTISSSLSWSTTTYVCKNQCHTPIVQKKSTVPWYFNFFLYFFLNPNIRQRFDDMVFIVGYSMVTSDNCQISDGVKSKWFCLLTIDKANMFVH